MRSTSCTIPVSTRAVANAASFGPIATCHEEGCLRIRRYLLYVGFYLRITYDVFDDHRVLVAMDEKKAVGVVEISKQPQGKRVTTHTA